MGWAEMTNDGQLDDGMTACGTQAVARFEPDLRVLVPVEGPWAPTARLGRDQRSLMSSTGRSFLSLNISLLS